jgi:hypothetical protein
MPYLNLSKYWLIFASLILIQACNPLGKNKNSKTVIQPNQDGLSISYSSPSFTSAAFQPFSITATLSVSPLDNCTVFPSLPNGLSLNPLNCEISGTPTVNNMSYYKITASSGSEVGSFYLLLDIQQVLPSIAFTGSPYQFPLNGFSTTGAVTNTAGAIFNCTVTPDLPTGLSINPTSCVISGTPSTLAGNTSHTITASNSSGNAAPVTITIGVLNTAPSLAYSNQTYSFNLYAASTSGVPTNTGGAINSCTATPALPSGLSISPTTCEISGTPTVLSAATNYIVAYSNAMGNGTSRVVNITVANVVPSISYASASYNFNVNGVSATGVPTNIGGAITGCLVSPALPDGLNLSSTTCEISGTSTAVTSAANYTITPSNLVGNGASRVLNITISNVVPSIAYSSATYNFIWNAISTSGAPTNAGGYPTNCTSSPALPAGLSLSPTTCEISGTPTVLTVAGNYTITPSNVLGNGASRILTISVASPIVTNGAWAIYDASSATSFPAGGAGQPWYDLSGNGRHATTEAGFTVVGLTNIGGRSVVLGEGQLYSANLRGSLPSGDTTYSFQTWIKFYGFSRNFVSIFGQEFTAQTFLSLDTTLGPNRAIRSFGYTIVPRIEPGIWYNLAVTINGTSARFYLNGSLVSSNSNGAALNGGTFNLGGRFQAGLGYINIGDLLIYSKTLSDSEVIQNYSNKVSTYSNTPPTQGTSNYSYVVGNACSGPPAGETYYSAIPAAVNTTFYLDSNLTIRAGSISSVDGIDYDIHGSGVAVDDYVFCD